MAALRRRQPDSKKVDRTPPPPPPLAKFMEPIVRERSRVLRRQRQLLRSRSSSGAPMHGHLHHHPRHRSVEGLPVFRRPLPADTREGWRLRLPPRAIVPPGWGTTGWDEEGYRLPHVSSPARPRDSGSPRSRIWPLSARRAAPQHVQLGVSTRRPATHAVRSAAAASEGGAGATVLGSGVRFDGSLMFDHQLEVEGECNGSLVSNGAGRLRVSAGGRVVGDVVGAEEVVVDGVVEGNLVADRVTLQPRAVVTGEVRALENLHDLRLSSNTHKLALLRRQLETTKQTKRAPFSAILPASSLSEAIRLGRQAQLARRLPSHRPPTLQRLHGEDVTIAVPAHQASKSHAEHQGAPSPRGVERGGGRIHIGAGAGAGAGPASLGASPHRHAWSNSTSVPPRGRRDRVPPPSPVRTDAAEPLRQLRSEASSKVERRGAGPTRLTLRQRVVRSRLQLLKQRTRRQAAVAVERMW